jgi:hypothetical protein
MAILALTSDNYGTPPALGNDPANRVQAVLRAIRWRLPATLADADGGSTIQICTLPRGGRYCSQLSKLGWKGFGVGRTLDLGWMAYRLDDGIIARADPTGLGTGLDVAADGRSFHDAFPLSSTDEWEAPAVVSLILTCRGGTIPAGTTLGGLLVYLSAA